MNNEKLKTWLQQTITENVENLNSTDEDYAKTISQDFEFHADGETCNLPQWIARIRSFKSQLIKLQARFEHLIAEDNTVAAIYYVTGTKKDGSEMTTKIIAFFKIKDEKLIFCDELTRLIKGSW